MKLNMANEQLCRLTSKGVIGDASRGFLHYCDMNSIWEWYQEF